MIRGMEHTKVCPKCGGIMFLETCVPLEFKCSKCGGRERQEKCKCCHGTGVKTYWRSPTKRKVVK